MKNTMDVVAMAHGTQECGAIVWWSLSGYVRKDALTKALLDAGLPELWDCRPVSQAVALTRAVMGLATNKRLVRALQQRGRYAVVDETVAGDDWGANVKCKIWLQDGTPHVEPYDPNLHAEVTEAYQEHGEILTHDDISMWLTNMTRQVTAVTLRDRGGIYFVPREHLPIWRKITAAIGSVSEHECYEVPALGSDEAISAIVTAVLREAAREGANIELALLNSELGVRALQGRIHACQAARAKVSKYEALLGVSMTAMVESLTVLEGQLAAAALAATPEVAQ